MSYFRSKHLIAAKALAEHDWAAPKKILLARHMAHDGATVVEIRNALGWTVTIGGARGRLARFNIHARANPSAHRGDETSLPPGCETTNMQVFRARELVPA